MGHVWEIAYNFSSGWLHIRNMKYFWQIVNWVFCSFKEAIFATIFAAVSVLMLNFFNFIDSVVQYRFKRIIVYLNVKQNTF